MLDNLVPLLRQLRGRIVLHFSDIQTGFTSLHQDKLHTDTQKQLDEVFEDVIADFHDIIDTIQQFKPIELVLISGDLGSTGKVDEYEELKRVLSFFHKLDFPVLMVPGNHEVNWDETKEGHDELKFKNFQSYLKEFTQNETRVQYNYEEDFCYFRLPGTKFLFIGINSSKKIDHEHREDAFVSITYLRRIKELIKQETSDLLSNLKNIIVCHHDAPTLIRCNQRLKQFFNSNVCFLILSGHIHQTNIYPFDDFKFKNICVGSLLTSLKERTTHPRGSDPVPRQFNLYSIQGENIETSVDILKFSYVNDEWKAEPDYIEYYFPLDIIRCPICGLKAYNFKSKEVHWNQNKNEFIVKLVIECRPCKHIWEHEIRPHLLTEVAKQSVCTCGGILKLDEDYRIVETENEAKFIGKYKCIQCRHTKKITFPNLITKIKRYWKSKKMLIDDKGLTFE